MSKIYFESIGEGSPILILHGGYLDHRHMVDAVEPVFEQVTGWRRLYIDIPGHGQSNVDTSVNDHDKVLDLILDFLDEQVPGEPCALIGESRGGYLARGIVYKKPERVSGALFIVPGRYAVAREGSVPEHTTIKRDDDLLATLPEHEAGRFNRLVVQNKGILEKIRATKIPAIRLADLAHQENIDKSYEFSFDVDSPPQPFNKPCLFLLGRQDAMVGYLDAWRALENFPRATFSILDKAGHSLSWEQPELFVALTREWLQRVQESGASGI